MDKKIEIKEQDSLTDIVVSQNERKFFHEFVSVKTSIDDELLDADTDMSIKTEIKSETPFINHFAEQIKTETASSSNSHFDSQKEGEFLPEHPVMIDMKYDSDHDIHNKIEIKEEPWWLEKDTSSVHDDIKDEDFTLVKSERLLSDSVSATVSGKSLLTSAVVSERDTTFCNGIEQLEVECKNNSADLPAVKEYVYSEKTGKFSDEREMYPQPLCLKQISLHHKSKRLHECNFCGKNFNYLSGWKRHILIHEGKKPHQCIACNKSFTQLAHLKTHYFLHEGKKPLQCKVCNQSFTHMSIMKKHNLIHEGKKPHKCKVCNKGFNQLSNLKTHSLIHERKKAHHCKTCDKSFTHFSSFKRHNLIHEVKKSQ